MALSGRSLLGLCGTVGGTVLLAALAMSPAVADGATTTGPLLASGCSATAHTDTQWGSGATGGQIVTVTIANTSPSTTTNWTVTWTLGADQRVASAWNAAASRSGGDATSAQASYNGILAPGAAAPVGMQLS